MKNLVTTVFAFFITALLSGQNDTVKKINDTASNRIYLLQKVKRNGEILPEIEMKEVNIYAVRNVSTRKEQAQIRKYDKLVYNLKRVYPYALIVRERLAKVNYELEQIKTEKERKEYIKNVEKEVFGEYEDDMEGLTLSQGKLLIKLIDRETSNTSYDLIKKYRGGLSAVFWQGIARIIGTNLKAEYDAAGDDILIEIILQEIEQGRL